MKTEKAVYEIGGVYAVMTAAQATRWNSGDTTDLDLDTATVAIPEADNQTRYVSLRRATNARLEPATAEMLFGMPAYRCGD